MHVHKTTERGGGGREWGWNSQAKQEGQHLIFCAEEGLSLCGENTVFLTRTPQFPLSVLKSSSTWSSPTDSSQPVRWRAVVVVPDFLHRRQLWEAIRKEDTKVLPWSGSGTAAMFAFQRTLKLRSQSKVKGFKSPSVVHPL